MTPTGRRVLAVTIVAIVTVATVGAQVMVTPTNVSAGSGVINQPMRAVASIRNVSAGPITIAITKIASPNCPASVTTSLLNGGDTMLAAQEQVQVLFSTPGFNGSDLMAGTSCTYSIVQTSPTGPPPIMIQVNFVVGTMGSPIDPQAQILDLRPPAGSSETQSLVISNYSPIAQSGITATINDSTGRVTFAGGGCANMQSCALTTIGINSMLDLPLKCDPQGQFANGSIQYTGGGSGSGLGGQSFACGTGSGSASPGQIKLDSPGYTINTPPNMLGSAFANVTFDGMTDALEGAALSGPDAAFFSFPNLMCNPCDFTGAPKPLPYLLTVGCTPDTQTRIAQLQVRGITSASDTADATVTCNPTSANGPILQVSTNTITIPGSVAVGIASGPEPLTITNAGTGTLTAKIRIPAPYDAEWTVSGCTLAAPCALVGNGSSAVVNVTLTPDAHGPRDGAMVVEANDAINPSEAVSLVGSGSGGFLVVDPTSINFGAFPRAQQRIAVVNLEDEGNVGLQVTIASPGAPFGASTTSVALAANGGTGSFNATCGPGAIFTGSGDYVLTSGAYNTPTVSIHADCTLVDTALEVTPLQFDFDELRIGDEAMTRPFAIKNPTSTPIVIADLRIANAPAVLSLMTPATNITLAQNQTLAGTIKLVSTADTVIAKDVALAFTADGVALALPITGKVVTPHAKVEPVVLDLGTACIGRPVSGSIQLVNDGTATLISQIPTIDQSFVTGVSTHTFPGPLDPTEIARIEIVPATTAVGPITGVLTWDVDVPGTSFTVPIDLEYIDAGTAISPERFDFRQVEVLASSDRRVVTLENCNLDPITVTVAGIVASQGGADAWDLQPRTEQRPLLPHDTLKLTIAFTPKTRGIHRAHIAIEADGTSYDVELVGEALGDPDPTSFYACSCSHGSPGGWPIGAALAVVVFVRRRRRARVSRV